jgi:hypothetical protein
MEITTVGYERKLAEQANNYQLGKIAEPVKCKLVKKHHKWRFHYQVPGVTCKVCARCYSVLFETNGIWG